MFLILGWCKCIVIFWNMQVCSDRPISSGGKKYPDNLWANMVCIASLHVLTAALMNMQRNQVFAFELADNVAESTKNIHGMCCGLQIRPMEEQLTQRVIGKRYCISRKRKSCKGSTSRARLAVRLSNVSSGTRSCLPRMS